MMAELEKAVRKIPASKISDNAEVSNYTICFQIDKTLLLSTTLLQVA